MIRDMGLDLSDPEEYRKFIRFALKYADCLGLFYTGDLSAFKESKWWGGGKCLRTALFGMSMTNKEI